MATAPADFTSMPKSYAGRRVLIVDDNKSHQAAMIEMLDRHDLEALVADNGKEAIELAKYRHPDLILMDIHMPVMNGFEATRKLRTLPQFASLPIVAVSANADPPAIQKCLAAGCNEHQLKPLGLSALNRLLEKYLVTG